MSPTGDGRRSERVGRAREGLRKGSERAGARLARGTGRAEALLARGLGEPALFAITLSAIVSSIFFSIGVVADDALGLTPVVFLVAAIFFVTTMATYVEGNSLHPERGGASTFARYAFDEFWSFVAGWAILLDYLIVMALAAVAVSDYLAAFWGELGSGYLETVIAALAFLFVVMANISGLGAERLRQVLRLSLVGIVLLAIVSGLVFAQLFDIGLLFDTVDLGTSPTWEGILFSTVIATGAMIGIEAASGLAGEVRVGRKGLRRFVIVTAVAAVVLLVGVSAAALMAVPVEGGETALSSTFEQAPVLGMASALDPEWLRKAATLRRGRDRRRHPDRGDERADARALAARVFARDQPSDPERAGPPPPAPRHSLRGHRRGGADLLRPRAAERHGVPGGHLRVRRDADVRDRAHVGDRAAVPRGRPPERLPRAALVQVPEGHRAATRGRRAPSSRWGRGSA